MVKAPRLAPISTTRRPRPRQEGEHVAVGFLDQHLAQHKEVRQRSRGRTGEHQVGASSLVDGIGKIRQLDAAQAKHRNHIRILEMAMQLPEEAQGIGNVHAASAILAGNHGLRAAPRQILFGPNRLELPPQSRGFETCANSKFRFWNVPWATATWPAKRRIGIPASTLLEGCFASVIWNQLGAGSGEAGSQIGGATRKTTRCLAKTKLTCLVRAPLRLKTVCHQLLQLHCTVP